MTAFGISTPSRRHWVRTGLVRDNPVRVYTDGTLTVNSPAFGVLLHELAEILTVSNVTVYAPMQ